MDMSNAQVLPFRWRPEVTFNDRLRLVRRDYGRRIGRKVSQEEMASLLGEKPGTYKAWESSGRPSDPVAFAKRLEAVTGADPVWLVDLTDDGPDTPDGLGSSHSGCYADVLPFPVGLSDQQAHAA